LVHLGGMARGGAGLVMTEATAIQPEGRTTHADTGLWEDAQAEAFGPIVDFVRSQGAVAGVQLAHAGRKGSTEVPWVRNGPLGSESGGWECVGPSQEAYGGWPAPRELDLEEIHEIIELWRRAAHRAVATGFEVLEIHAAHGYLLHQFLSPLANRRTDEYGGDLRARARLLLEVVEAVRAVWPDRLPLFVRVSGSDWVEGGLEPEEVAEVAAWLGEGGVDLIDVSSGGVSPDQRIPVSPGYQVPLARTIRERSGLPTAAVGLITTAAQAEGVLLAGDADAVFLGRALLHDPNWPRNAALELGQDPYWPAQYLRIKPRLDGPSWPEPSASAPISGGGRDARPQPR
jgi:2,4-dienoyl-CoA reductase-like NADH-dependent reductase (Old Yellow Enzyme family)